MNQIPENDELRSAVEQSSYPFLSRIEIAFKLIIIFIVGGLLSFVCAVLSVNSNVIKIFIWVNIACFIGSVIQFLRARYTSAYTLAFAPVPLSFAVVIALALGSGIIAIVKSF